MVLVILLFLLVMILPLKKASIEARAKASLSFMHVTQTFDGRGSIGDELAKLSKSPQVYVWALSLVTSGGPVPSAANGSR